MKRNRELLGYTLKDIRSFVLMILTFLVIVVILILDYTGDIFDMTMYEFIAIHTLPLLGLVLFASDIYSPIHKRKIQKKIKSEGKYVLAKITGIINNKSVICNEFNAHAVECTYVDESGNSHEFCSNYLRFDPVGLIKESKIVVYISDNNYEKYYVDIDSAMIEEEYVFEGEPLNKDNRLMAMVVICLVMSLLPILVSFIIYTLFNGEKDIFLVLLTGLMPFFILGIIGVVYEYNIKKLFERCRKNNKYVMAEVIAVCIERSTWGIWTALKNRRLCDKEAYYLQCIYKSGDGTAHIFKTRQFLRAPKSDPIGREIKVYCDGNMKKYFVDMNDIMSTFMLYN